MSDREKRHRGDEEVDLRRLEREKEIERRALRLLIAGRDWVTAVLEATRQVDAIETSEGTRRRSTGIAPGRVNRSARLDDATITRLIRGGDRRPDERRPGERRPDERRPDERRPDERRLDKRRTDGRTDTRSGFGRIAPPRGLAERAAGRQFGSGTTIYRFVDPAAAEAPEVDPHQAAAQAFSGSGSEVPFRSEMEASFGTSFADVRVHTGEAARTAAAQLGAEAFTTGNQIAFVSSSPDRELVAHELAHVVQARGGSTGTGMSRPSDALEREAEAVAAAVITGRPAFGHVEKYEGRKVETPGAPIGRSAGFGRARAELPARHRAPWGKPAAAGAVLRRGTEIKTLTITPIELVADGKDKAKAVASTDPVGKTVEWSLDGPAFGTTIDKSTGEIVAGASIAPEPKSVSVWIRAKADTATKKAPVTLWDQQYKKALDDYPKFISGTYALPDFKPGVNGNFDAKYAPAAKTLTATMRLKFDYTNDKSSTVEKMVEAVRRAFGDDFGDSYASSHGMWTVKDKDQFQKDFQKHIKGQWHDRYTFSNVREPKDVWSKLGPVHVNLDLSVVNAGQHFTITAHKGPGRAEVVRPNMKLYEGDLTPSAQFGNTGADELGRLNAIMPSQVLFDFDSSAVKAPDADKLTRTATYLRRATQPRFIIDLVGHASNPGADKYNQKLSENRAEAVKAHFVGGGAAAAHTITASGVGEAGATKDALWQRVDLTAAVDPAFVNKLDTAGHEFGHMLGVGDEYGTKGDKTSHWNLVKKAFGQQYADDVALKDVPGGGSIMRGGQEVRIYHYVTFWQALCESTLKAALPDPKFGYDDWKFNE